MAEAEDHPEDSEEEIPKEGLCRNLTQFAASAAKNARFLSGRPDSSQSYAANASHRAAEAQEISADLQLQAHPQSR